VARAFLAESRAVYGRKRSQTSSSSAAAQHGFSIAVGCTIPLRPHTKKFGRFIETSACTSPALGHPQRPEGNLSSSSKKALPSLPSQTLAPCICARRWCSSRCERLRWYGTNCVIACCNRVNAARAVIVARACGWESSSVKIASAARLAGVSIQKGICVRALVGTRNTHLAIGPAPKIGDRKVLQEWVRPDDCFSLASASCVGAGHNGGGVGICNC
jgi:hypothetical protein